MNAAGLNTAASTISKYLSGDMEPSVTALRAFFVAVGASADEVLELAPPPAQERVVYDRDEELERAADAAKLNEEQRERLYTACRSIGPMTAGELLQTAERIARNAATDALAHPKNVDRTEVDPKRDRGNLKAYKG